MMPSLPIPEELIEQFERGNVIPLVGQGIGIGHGTETGLPSLDELTLTLVDKLDYKGANLPFAQITQLYEMERGRHALIDFLRRQFLGETGQLQPLSAHRALTRLNWQVIISTCLDDALAVALTQAQIPYNRIVGDVDVAYEDQSKRLIVQMYGQLDQPESVVITEMDHLRWQEEVEAVFNLLKGLIASRTLLTLGQDLDDDHFKNIYARVTLPFKRNIRRSYACHKNPSAYTVAWWEKLNVQIIPAEPGEFLSQLIEQVNARRTQVAAPSLTATESLESIPRQPYKFLNAYESDDRAIFFGRDQEKWQILSKISSFRLILLHGRSGVGKTSLIKAGLMPELQDRGYYPIYARVLTQPLKTVKDFIQKSLGLSLSPEASLRDMLIQAGTYHEDGLVLFLDQFEELFTPSILPSNRTEFLKALGEIYVDTKLDLKIVIGIREDFLAELSALKPVIPEIFFNDYRLQRLSAEKARQAIVGPVTLYDIGYEAGLVDYLVEDLGAERIDPPQLQIVCDKLFENLNIGTKTITLDMYHALGGARTILIDYVDEVMRQYPQEQRTNLQLLLKEFITADERPCLPTVEELAQRTGLTIEEVQHLLKELETTRLIRPVEAKIRFELIHDYLITHISSWVSEEEHDRKRAQMILDQSLSRWQNYQLPLYVDELTIINDYREQLLLNDEARSLLIFSAVWTNYAVDYWLPQGTTEQCNDAVRAALEDVDPDRRFNAVNLTGQFECDDQIECLQEIVVEDPSSDVRRAAVRSLARMQNGAQLVDWLALKLDECLPDQRTAVLEAIEELQQASDLTLSETGRVSRFQIRWQIVKLRWRRNHRQWRRVAVYALLGGALGGGAGGALGVIMEGAIDQMVIATMLAMFYGLLQGVGIGGGYGSIVALQEPRRSILYVFGAALGGGIIGFLGGIADIQPARIIWAIPIGVVSSASSGAMIALLINLSDGLSRRFRLIVRLVLGTILGIFTAGFLLALGSFVDLGIVGPVYGMSVGTFAITGITVGIHLIEQQLIKEVQENGRQ